MKRIIPLLLLIICVITAQAQKVNYSAVVKEEDEDINFEVLGKFDSTILIYKNIRSRHYISVYDNQMKLLKNRKLGFMPDRTFNVDFVVQPKGICMLYQYNKGGQIFCYGVSLSASAEELSAPVLLDTSKVSVVADKRIYSVAYSENRKMFMLYKLHIRDQNLNLLTKLYNDRFEMIDSSRYLSKFEDDRELWGDAALSNEGDFYLVQQKRLYSREGYDDCNLFVKKQKDPQPTFINFVLDGKLIDDVRIRVDNRNDKVLLNALYYTATNPHIQGLFAASVNAQGAVQNNFNEFDSDVRAKLNVSGKPDDAFDDLFLGQVFVRKNGSYLLTSESSYSRATADNRRMGRWDNFGIMPFSTFGNPYYFYNPYFYNYGFYRPPMYYSGFRSTRYFADDILVMSVDTNLRIQWNSLITKRQFFDDNENYISFSTLMISGELHFFFIPDNKKNEVVANMSILPDGTLRKNPQLRAGSALYEFMPRLAKQISAGEIIIPCSYRGNIVFAIINMN